MKWPLILAGCAAVLESLATAEPAARLYWRNGESLPGSPVAADLTTVSWKTELMAAPVVLDRSRLLFMDFSPPKDTHPTDVLWSLLLRNGDCVHGDSARLAHGKVEIHCPRHGDLSVPLEQVRSLRRLQGGSLIYGGPCGQAGWTGTGFITDGGGLATRKWDETLQLPMKLPDQVAVDIVMRSTQLLNFRLALRAQSKVTPTIETWGSDVVLVAPTGCTQYGLFTPLLKLTGHEPGLALRLYWDQTAQRIQVFDLAGKELGHLQWTMAGASSERSGRSLGGAAQVPGVAVKNRGGNWVIDELCVRRWDGVLPKPVPAAMPRVELTDGSWKGEADLKDMNLDEVESVTWTETAPPWQPSYPRPAAAFTDGTMISGALVSWTEEGIVMQPAWSQKPVRCESAGLLRLVFEPPAHPMEELATARLDRLHLGPVNVHGTIVCDGGSEPRWRFVGGRDVLPLPVPEKPEDLELTWSRPADASPQEAPPSMIVTDDGGALRAGFKAIDETGVSFDSPWASGHCVPHQHMRAVQLKGVAAGIKGFRDPGWTLYKGSERQARVVRGEKPETDALRLDPGALYGHAGLVHGDDIRFTFSPVNDGYGGLVIDLFASEGEGGKPGMKLTLWVSGNQLYAQAGDSGRGVGGDQMLRKLPDSHVSVKILFRDSKVQLLANETILINEPIPPALHDQTGLAFSCGSIWGNNLMPVNVTDFVVVDQAGSLNGLQVPAEAKQEALVIPRFRREQAPSHALVAANGDLVRGEVDAATDKLVRFTTGLETHDLKTDVLQAIVWLGKPKSQSKTEPAPQTRQESKATHWVILNDHSRLPVQVDAIGEDGLVGHSALLGKIRLPIARIAALRWAPPAASASFDSYNNWQLEEAPEPVLPEAGEQASKLLGQAAPDFLLKMLGEGEFHLSKKRGHEVVVIDFWATWCGPCVASMPGLIDVMKSFKDKPVTFITLNQGEPPDQVKRFIERRKWDLPVAMDANAIAAGKYGVEGIPHTVVVGMDGKVEWTHTGYSADGAAKLTEAVNKALHQ